MTINIAAETIHTLNGKSKVYYTATHGRDYILLISLLANIPHSYENLRHKKNDAASYIYHIFTKI